MRLRDILKLDVQPTDVVAFGPALDAIDAYVRNPNSPRSGKLQALAKLDELLGLPKPANPEFALNTYLAIADADAVFVDDSTLSSHDDGSRFNPADHSEREDVTRAELYAKDDFDDEDESDTSRWD